MSSILILPPLQGFSSEETDFHFCQHLSNFFKYSSSNFLSSYPNNIFAIYFPGSSHLLNSSAFGFNFTFHLSSIPSYLLTSILILPSNLSTNSLVFFKYSSFSYISFSAVNPFQCTKYFSIPYIFLLFNIFSTSHFSTPFTSTGFSSSTLCLFTSSLYLTTCYVHKTLELVK